MSNQVYSNDYVQYTDDDVEQINNQFYGVGQTLNIQLTGPWSTVKNYMITYYVTSDSVILKFPEILITSDNNSQTITSVIPLPSNLLIPSGNFYLTPVVVINQGNRLNGILNINMTSGILNFYLSPTSSVFAGGSGVGIEYGQVTYYLTT